MEKRFQPLAMVAPQDNTPSAITSALNNISALIPADATALYLTGLNIVENKALDLWIVTLFSLLFALGIRFYLKASSAIMIVTGLSFLVWIYGIGGGLIELYNLDIGALGGFFIFAYSVVVAWMGSVGIIKN